MKIKSRGSVLFSYLLPCAVLVGFLVAACLVASSGKNLWYDEIVTTCFAADTSLSHMLGALHDQVDLMPPLWFILAWFWAKIWGAGVVSLRMLSCVGVGIAGCLLYSVLYRAYKFWPAFLGTFIVFLSTQQVLYYNAEARPYGFLLALCAWGIWLYYKACDSDVVSGKLALSFGVWSAALVLTHLYGFLFGFLVLVALVLRDRHFGISRPRIYLAIAGGWLCFLLWLPSAIHQFKQITYGYWIGKPGVQALFDFYLSVNMFMAARIFLLVIIFYSFFFDLEGASAAFKTESTLRWKRSDTSLCFLSFSLLSAPVISWLLSQFFVSSFYPRYLFPAVLAMPCVLAILFSRIGYLLSPQSGPGNIAAKVRMHSFFVVLLIASIGAFGMWMSQQSRVIRPSPWVEDERFGRQDLPIVTTDPMSLKNRYYAAQKERYVYLLDWDFATRANRQYHYFSISALSRHYFPGYAQDAKTFLEAHSAFLVLRPIDDPTDWFAVRIKGAPGYRTEVLGRKGDGFEMVYVEKTAG